MVIYKDSPFEYELPLIPLDSHGVCKKGLALEMKRRYPYAASAYKRLCIEKEFNAGDLYIHEDKDGFGNIHQMIWICQGKGTLNDIEQCMKNIAALTKVDDNIDEIAIGGFKALAEWGDIKYLMKRYLRGTSVYFIIVEEYIKNEIIDNLDFRDAWRRR